MSLQHFIDESLAYRLSGVPNSANALMALAGLVNITQGMYPGERATLIHGVITKWYNYIQESKFDINQNDLGAVYRAVASAYNHQADNIRDEAHTTTVDR